MFKSGKGFEIDNNGIRSRIIFFISFFFLLKQFTLKPIKADKICTKPLSEYENTDR